MEQQKQVNTKTSSIKTYSQSWKQFFDRAMQILIQNPVTSRYVLKYNSQKHIFVLKVTNGANIVMKKCNADVDYDEVEKFTKLAARALSNQSDKKVQQTQDQASKNQKKNKKNKKKR